jgi:DNA-binding NarL/FixJ family response regulator
VSQVTFVCSAAAYSPRTQTPPQDGKKEPATMLTQISNRQIVTTRSPPTRQDALTSISQPAHAGALFNSACMGLTARQQEVLAVLMQGKSNKAICRVLKLAEPTVKNHITAIFKALNVTNRTEAVIKVTKASLPTPSYTYTIAGYSMFSRG